MTLTQSELKKRLKYDPETGIFTWLTASGSSKIGAVAGNFHPTTGYLRITINRKAHSAHRLAWLYVYGEFPPKGMETDHINHDKLDNRIKNLRIVTQSQNSANSKVYSTNKLGVRGVIQCPRTGRFFARIKHNGKNRHLGTFNTIDEAAARFSQEAKAIWGECFHDARTQITPSQ